MKGRGSNFHNHQSKCGSLNSHFQTETIQKLFLTNIFNLFGRLDFGAFKKLSTMDYVQAQQNGCLQQTLVFTWRRTDGFNTKKAPHCDDKNSQLHPSTLFYGELQARPLLVCYLSSISLAKLFGAVCTVSFLIYRTTSAIASTSIAG